MNSMMAQNEEQEHKNSSNGNVPVPCFSASMSNVVSSSSSSSSKKNKHKIPQRGMGVAQLERLRLEELQRKNGKSPSTPFPQELCIVQQKACSSVTKPDSLPSLPSNSTSSSGMMTVGVDFFPVQHQVMRNSRNGLLPATIWRAMVPCMRNSFTSNSNSNNFFKRLQPRMQFANTSMNVASSNKSPEVVNTPIEPPSNQSYNDSRYNLLTYWREQDDREFERDQEMNIRKKRSWPFYVESIISQPPYPSKVPSLCNSCIKPECFLPCCGNSIVVSEIPNCTFRVPTSSYNLEFRSHDLNHANNTQENCVGRDSIICTPLSSAPTTPTVATSMGNSANFSHSNEKTFYSFLRSQEDSRRTSSPEQKEDIVDDLDLTLKL